MTGLLNKLERKFGKYAITNLSLYIIIGYAIGYLLQATGSIEFICLNPNKIVQGQIWRIITWVLVPPTVNLLTTIIMLYFYYQLGAVLERTWGTFKFNVYIISGIILTVIGAISLYYILLAVDYASAERIGIDISIWFNTFYINLSIFLAFATLYPNMQVLLFFVIPVKMKWMAYVYLVINLYQFFDGDIYVKVAIVMSLLNFFIFFFSTRDYKRVSPKEFYRRKAFRDAMNQAGSRSAADGYSTARGGAITKHKCAICGRTERDGDNLEFRFCSKCNGNYEYCNEHLFTHKHVM
ncbi:MAG: hypothetical protein E7298_04810 [Lachnospiraceae bacterium]|nr:hypothetical protein [Lachnospiraceae bacterium]